ncbi:hypothetical protein HRbin15_01958 [bacterium HR15]|nr:hypothetical protein HRbin15_01958 [bacterium HR15]
MKTEIDPKLAWGIIVALVIIVVAVYYYFFRTPSGIISAKEAGAGNPVHPGELPPGIPPPPEERPFPSGQSQPNPSNTR